MTFRFQEAKDCNKLPTEIKNSATLLSFKTRLKQYYIILKNSLIIHEENTKEMNV